jgi:hypothetical protein
MLPVLFEELGRKQQNSAIGRNQEDGLPRLRKKPGKVFRGFPSGFAPAKTDSLVSIQRVMRMRYLPFSITLEVKRTRTGWQFVIRVQFMP